MLSNKLHDFMGTPYETLKKELKLVKSLADKNNVWYMDMQRELALSMKTIVPLKSRMDTIEIFC